MTSIKDFLNEKKLEKNKKNLEYEKIMQENPKKIGNIEENLNKYKNLSQNDLMNELFKEANRMKENGSLNEESLNMLKNTLSPILDSEQNKKLNEIINKIK